MFDHRPFDEIDEASVRDLISNKIPESSSVEYKQATYGSSDSNKKEFLKDISAFANSTGGHLVIGIRADEGITIDVSPLQDINVDAELQRLESMVHDGLEPRVQGIRMKRVETHAGPVIVIRVPRSWNPPHRVRYARSNRFWARNSAGKYEIGVEELRSLFFQKINIEDRAKEFIRARTEELQAHDGLVPLQWGNGSLVIHLLPLPDFGAGTVFDMVAAREQRAYLPTLGIDATSVRLNLEGLCNHSPNRRIAYTQLFRNGAIEAVLTGIGIETRESKADQLPAFISGPPLGKWLIDAVPRYVTALRNIGANSPVLLSISMADVQGLRLEPGTSSFPNNVVFDRMHMIIPPVTIDTLAEEVSTIEAIREVLDIVWNAFDYDRCSLFTQDGEWTG